MLTALAFYLFAGIAIAAAAMVITSRNPVHSVMFLILTFFNAAALFVLMGAEFLAMILVVVYVGAVAVLFLFVVMMLDINFVKMREGFIRYLPVGAAIGVILLAELIFIGANWVISPEAPLLAGASTADSDVTNTEALGRLLYTEYVYFFQAAGMVLLVAMIGAIVLTLRSREGVKKQSITKQLDRRREEGVEIKQVQSGSGIS